MHWLCKAQSYLPLESDRRHLRVGQNYLPYAQRENPNSVINVCAPTTLSTQKVKGALGTCTVLSKGTFISNPAILRFPGLIICAFQYVAPTPYQHWNVFIGMPSSGCLSLDTFLKKPLQDALFGTHLLGCFLWDAIFRMSSSDWLLWDTFSVEFLL